MLESLRARLESLCDAHCVGVIILDEAQNLLGSRSRKTELFNFIVEFSNTINAPIIFAGTPKILEICQQGMRVSRRLGTIGCLQWDRMGYRDRDWNAFIGELWKYNVLPSEVPLIIEELCFCSSLYATRAYFIKAGLDFDHKLAFFENRYCYKNTFNI
ncbi:MAG: ATP-binding protein [Succinimonas sp.]|nr:ATP-binding protein [Succinimonas sp.]